MTPLRYARASDVGEASAALVQTNDAMVLAGGTNVIDYMKIGVEQPQTLIDITGLPLRDITVSNGSVHIGALATMTRVADAPDVQRIAPAVSQALLLSASPQLRNMASIGGNVLQRTRCAYFRDTAQACNKRVPGSGCSAMHGDNRFLAVIGTSDHCIASYPSDFGTALAAVDAIVHVRSANATRTLAFEALHVLPGTTPHIETRLQPGELIESIEIPGTPASSHSAYIKVRDRASYQFALVSAAAALDIRSGTIRTARVSLGSVAPIPWRAHNVEAALVGRPATPETFATAARLASDGMHGHGQNDYKLAMTRDTVRRALAAAAGMA